MNNTINFQTKTWLENASMVGLTRVASDGDYQVDRNKVELNVSALDNFADKYFHYFIRTYGKYTRYWHIIDFESTLKSWQDYDFEDFNQDKLKILIDYFNNQIKYSFLGSMKSFKTVAKLLNDDFDVVQKAKDCNAIIKKLSRKNAWTKYPEESLEEVKDVVQRLIDIIEYLKSDRASNYYPAQLLIYMIIQNGWNNTAFLDPANNREPDFYKSYELNFVQPVRDYLQADHDNDKFNCSVCGRPFTKRDKDGFRVTFVNGMGYDYGKKKSNAWNFQNDYYICPICHLMYTLIPAGFTYNQFHQGIFINATPMIAGLKNANDAVLNRMTNAISGGQSMSSYKALASAFEREAVRSQQYPLANIQLITYDDEKYDFKIVSSIAGKTLKETSLISFKSGQTLLESLQKIGIANYQGQNYYNVYNEIIKRILNNTDLSSIIYTLEMLKATGDSGAYYGTSNIMNIITLNSIFLNALSKQKGENNMQISEEDLRKCRSYGIRIRDGYANKSNANKSQALSYRMLEALRTGDSSRFMDLMLNAYLYLGMIVPSIFINNQDKTKAFKQYGYAFVSGLIGSTNTETKEN